MLSPHLVLGLRCRLDHSRDVHAVTLFVHMLSLNRAICSAHPRIPFLIGPKVYDVFYYPGITFVVT